MDRVNLEGKPFCCYTEVVGIVDLDTSAGVVSLSDVAPDEFEVKSD